MRNDGSIQGFDPQTGELEGDSWRVTGWPAWISVAPNGERIAVMYWTARRRGRPRDERRERWEIRLAIVSTEDDRVLYDEPMVIGGHVMLEDGDLITMEDNRVRRCQDVDRSLVWGLCRVRRAASMNPSLTQQ